MAVKFQFRRDTAANWESNNPILSEGEFGLDLTNQRFKIGDGVANWNDIEFSQYTNKAETFAESVTLLGSETTDPEGSDWDEETSGPWEGVFTTTKTVNGIITTDTPFIEIDLSNADATDFEIILGAYGSIFRAEVVSNNNLKFYATEDLAPDLPILIKVVR